MPPWYRRRGFSQWFRASIFGSGDGGGRSFAATGGCGGGTVQGRDGGEDRKEARGGGPKLREFFCLQA